MRLLGASDRLLPYCVEYGRILFGSAFFTVIQVMYQALFITAGRGRIALWLTVGSGVLNLVLDWLLIGVLDLGMTGAALGTVSGRILGRAVPPLLFFEGPEHPAVSPPPVGPGHAGAGHGQRVLGDGLQPGHLGDHPAVQSVHAGAGRRGRPGRHDHRAVCPVRVHGGVHGLCHQCRPGDQLPLRQRQHPVFTAAVPLLPGGHRADHRGHDGDGDALRPAADRSVDSAGRGGVRAGFHGFWVFRV